MLFRSCAREFSLLKVPRGLDCVNDCLSNWQLLLMPGYHIKFREGSLRKAQDRKSGGLQSPKYRPRRIFYVSNRNPAPWDNSIMFVCAVAQCCSQSEALVGTMAGGSGGDTSYSCALLTPPYHHWRQIYGSRKGYVLTKEIDACINCQQTWLKQHLRRTGKATRKMDGLWSQGDAWVAWL